MGKEGRKIRGGHLSWEGYGVPRAEGTDPQVPRYPESRGLDWVRSLH